jgi:nicotinamidase-related amidase
VNFYVSATWKDGVENWPRALPTFEIDPETTALIIVDVQNYDAKRGYGLANVTKEKYPEMYDYYYDRVDQLVLPNCKRLLHYFRENQYRVLFLTIGPELPDGSDYFTPRRAKDQEVQKRTGKITLFCKGSFEHAVVDELKPAKNELVLNKTTASAFNSTGLDGTLRKMGVSSLVFAGVLTNSCVAATATDAADRWYKCIIAEDATATFTEEAHFSALRNFARLYGMVEGTDEVIALMEARKQG